MPQSTTDNNLDLFDSADFSPEKIVLPWLQVLHNEDPEKAGFFLTVENAEASDIIIPQDWQPHKVRFKSGDVDRATGKFTPSSAEGYLFSSARMLIVRQGVLSMYSKRSGNNSETCLGRYDYQTYQAQKSNIILKTKYLIYLLLGNNKLLHQSPLQFTTKGVFGATFAEHLKAFQTELQKSYGKQRGEKFLINGVFAVKIASELRGTPPDTAWCSVVESHQIPTKDNWRELFVGYDEAMREKLLADYEAFTDFDRKSQKAQDPPAGDPGLESEMPDGDGDPVDLF